MFYLIICLNRSDLLIGQHISVEERILDTVICDRITYLRQIIGQIYSINDLVCPEDECSRDAHASLDVW